MSTRSPNGALTLRIVAPSGVAVQSLPSSGRLSIGRSRSCDVAVADTGISRQHAILHLGERLLLEDLGSANGSKLCGPIAQQAAGSETVGTDNRAERALAPREIVDLRIGDAFQLGSTLFFVEEERRATDAGGAIVRDPAIQRLFALAAQVALGDISVLILGETGVGKELLAEHVVRSSKRKDGPFLRLNCAAFADTLLESELFGHERGAFTGAVKAKAGLIEAADGGTVFLDEVGEMPPATQVKLLRVLESRMVQRIGALAPKPVDVRFVSATNRDLATESTAGRFRQDLYFRLNGVELAVPALRERGLEIEPLAISFVTRAASAAGKPVPAVDADALAALMQHSWPGNIRELKNVMERAVLLCGGGPIRAEHLPWSDDSGNAGLEKNLKRELEQREKIRILEALEQCGGNQSLAAKRLGISRTTLWSRLQTWGANPKR